MEFEKKVPVWNAAGVEPPEDLKNSGFTAGYKPPADFFNWFMHGASEAMQELQDNCATAFKIYTSLEQLGLVDDEWVRMTDIVDALPANCMLITEIKGSKYNVFPEEVPGLLQVMHLSNGLFEFKWAPVPDSGASADGYYFCFMTEGRSITSWCSASNNYAALSHIGINTTQQETIENIAFMLPLHGRISYGVTEDNAAIYPTKHGLVEAYKADSELVLFKFTSDTNELYMGTYTETGTGSYYNWTGWQKVANDAATDTDPGAGAAVDYPDGTVIYVYE